MKLTNKAILVFILFVATILRFYNYSEIPFSHDEFSALFRLNFDSFSELIEKGVKIDGHPAGIQVFLYYWTKLFGFQEWIIKLPFTIFGIFSVYLIYLIGKNWFNETVGLLAATYMASIQYTIMYSQIARPYMSGMFFSLLMIFYWSKLMLNSNKDFNKNYLMFIVSASLCTYNHHFSLLFSAIVGISGIFFVKRKFTLKYLLSGLIIFILYIPHLKIFFYQLNVGGVGGWLGKPQNDFLLEYIYYIFNFSSLVITSTIALVLYSLFKLNIKTINVKLILLSFAWFIIPFLIGFYYSRYQNSVLQFSVLIFSFPLLFFVLFGLMKNQKPKVNFGLVLVILLVNITSLVYGRKHYDIFYKSIYKHILIDYENVKENDNKTIYLVDTKKSISDYYISKLNMSADFINYSDSFQNIKELKNYLEAKKNTNDKLFLGCLSSFSPNIIPVIQDYYPYIENQNNYFGGTTYLFSKLPNNTNATVDCLNFDSDISKKWYSIDRSKIELTNDTIRNNVYLMDSNGEWGPTFSIPLEDIMKNENNFIDISVKLRTKEDLNEVMIVGSIESNKEKIWSATKFNEYIQSDQNNDEWISAHHSIKLSDLYLKNGNETVKIFIWNKGKNNFEIDDFSIKLRKGNPIIYGLIEKT